MERSRNVADAHHLRLMSLLQELVRDKGGMKGAARVLGIDHRTVATRPPTSRLTQIRARIIAPVTPSPPSAVLTPSIPVHRWIRA